MDDSNKKFNKQDLIKIAKLQKTVLIAFCITLVTCCIPILGFIVALCNFYYFYKLLCTIKQSHAWVYIILLFIPLISLIVYLHFIIKATKILQQNNIRVGLFGAKMLDFEKIK